MLNLKRFSQDSRPVWAKMMAKLFRVIKVDPQVGTMVCHFARGHLLPGVYSMNVYCTVNGELADWVQDAARIEVAEGDMFGTGRIPPAGYGNVVAQHDWMVEEAG